MGRVDLLFLGTGTSAGVPMIGCDCAVCTSADPRDKRTRTSAVVSYDGCHVLIDTTPELRLQAVANRVNRIDAVVFTHAHADHIMGLDDVRRFNTLRGGPLDVWADARTHASLQKCFPYAFQEPDPLSKLYRPHLIARTIEGDFDIGSQTWRPIKLMHGDMPTLGFRVGRLAYCTDVSFIPDESWELLGDLDVLVLDALQREKHSTHFTLEEAMDVVRKVKPRQAYFTHIAHKLGHEATNQSLPPSAQLAYDGQRISTTQ